MSRSERYTGHMAIAEKREFGGRLRKALAKRKKDELLDALVELSRTFGALRVAPLFITAPESEIEQPDFLNTVVELRVATDPISLLDWAKATERQLGRVSGPRNGPPPRSRHEETS